MHTVDLRRPRRFVTACAAVAALTWLAPQHVSAEVANPDLIPNNCAYIVSVPDSPAFWAAWEGNALYGSFKKVMESEDIQEKTANFRKELSIIESSLGFKIDGKTLSSIFGSADAYFVPGKEASAMEGVAILKITDEDKLNKLIDLAEKAATQAAVADDESTDTESADKSTSSPIQESEYQGVAIKAYEFDQPGKSDALEDEDEDSTESDTADSKDDDKSKKSYFIYAKADGKLLLSSNMEAMHKVIDRVKTPPTSDTVATFEAFKKINSALANEKGQLYLYGNQQIAWDQEVADTGKDEEVPVEFMKALRNYVDNIQPMTYYGASVTVAPKEIASYTYGLLKDDVSSDSLALKNSGSAPLKAASYIPDGSLMSFASSLFDANSTYNLVEAAVKSFSKDDDGGKVEDVKKNIDKAETEMGFSIKNDLVPAIGHELAFSINNVRSSGFIPMVDVTVMIGVGDKAKMQKVVDSVEKKITENIAKNSSGSDAAELKTEEFNGVNLKNIEMSKLMGYNPGFVLTDDFLIIGSNKDALKKSIEAKDGKNLGNSDTLKSLGHSISANANALQFFNIGKTLDIASEFMKSIPAAKEAEPYVEALSVLDVVGSSGRIENGAAVSQGVVKLK